MYNKTTWNPGDIITQEKWDNINNNLSILGAYQLPVTIEEAEEEEMPKKVVAADPSSSSSNFNIMIHKSYNEITKLLKQGVISSSNFNIMIHKSYNEITKLLKQGVICWYYNNLDGTINYITQFNDQDRTLNDEMFYFDGTEMTNIDNTTQIEK